MKNIGFYIIFIILVIILAFLVNYIIEETSIENGDENLLEVSYFCNIENNSGAYPISIWSCDFNNNKFYTINYGGDFANPVYTINKELIDRCNSISISEFCKNLICSKTPSKTLRCNW